MLLAAALLRSSSKQDVEQALLGLTTVTRAFPTQVPRPDSANDSIRGGGNRQAFDLANLIRSGAVDPGNEEAIDPLAGEHGAARGRGKHSQASSVLGRVGTEVDSPYASADGTGGAAARATLKV
ncbi:hypothetical protein LTR22_004113 [Elasticomyces elasticus]|nr:hypothetical protein LTR22_004113 [Elasticomyces elasticus]